MQRASSSLYSAPLLTTLNTTRLMRTGPKLWSEGLPSRRQNFFFIIVSGGCRHCQRIVPAEMICRLEGAALADSAGRLGASFAEELPAQRRQEPLRFAGARCCLEEMLLAQAYYRPGCRCCEREMVCCSCVSILSIRICSLALLSCGWHPRELSIAHVMRTVAYKPRGPTAGKTAAEADGARAVDATEGRSPKPKEGALGRAEAIGILAAAMTGACTAAGCRDVKARNLSSPPLVSDMSSSAQCRRTTL